MTSGGSTALTRAVLEFHLLGGFTVHRGGEPLPPIPSRTGRSLLAFLVTHGGRAHQRDALAGRFWPDLPTSRARRRLSHTLWQIQDTLGEAADHAFLEATLDALRVPPDASYSVDVREFEETTEAVRRGGRSATETLRLARHAIDLYGGDFLSGMYDEWALAEQERLAQVHLRLLGDAIDAAKAVGEYEEALAYTRRLTHHAPLREDAHREAMRLCVLLGRASEALALYDRCRSLLEEELGTEPAEATTELYERISRLRETAQTARQPEGQGGTGRIPLVGRATERAEVIDRLEQALAGRGGLVFVEGDAGVGKSRLVEAAVEDAEWRGFAVLAGTCDELGPARPYAPLVEALDASLGPVRVQQLRPRVHPVWIAEASAAVPGLRRVAGTPPGQRLTGLEGTQRMREAIAQVLLAHGEVRPTLLVVEDVHWADEETLELLHVLGPRLADRRLAVLVTFRGAEARAAPDVWERLRRIDQRTAPSRIHLAPLDDATVHQMVRGLSGPALDDEVVARIAEETGGNPLFVLETVRALGEADRSGEGEVPALEELPLARTIQETISARLRILGDDERHVLEVVATHGRGAELETILAAAAREPVTVADAIEALVGRGFMREEAETYGLQHDLTRRIVYDRLDAEARRRHHERVGTALESTRPDDVEALARHFTEADVPGKAVRYLTAAADRATQIHAYEAAARHRASAIAMLDRTPSSVEARFRLLADHEAVLDILGRRDEQAEVLERMGKLAVDRTDAELEVHRRRAWHHLHLDRFDEAIAECDRALSSARDGGDVAATVRLLTTRGTALEWSGRWAEAVEAHEQAVALADDDRARMEAEVALGNALRGLARYDDAAEALRRALESADAIDDQRQRVRILGALANVAGEAGNTVAAGAKQREALEAARAIGFRHGEGMCLMNLAIVGYHRGEIADSMRLYNEALRVFEDLGNRRAAALSRTNAASARIEILGEHDEAVADLEEAREFFADVGDVATAAQCEQLLGRADLMRGAVAGARDRHEHALEMIAESPVPWLEVQFLRDLAEVELAEGVVDRALAHTDRALAACADHGMRDLAVGISALRGRILVAAGRADEALAETTSAVERLDGGVERPHLVLWAHHLSLDAAGRAEDAGAALDEAVGLLDRLLEGLDESSRRRAVEGVPSSASIVAAAVTRREEVVEVEIADADAPTGRPLGDEDRVVVAWTLRTAADEAIASPVERRRRRLLRLVGEAIAQGASPTVEDLAGALEVSAATVRRDLTALRGQGHDLRTRGSRAS